jgi:hypothetical protein
MRTKVAIQDDTFSVTLSYLKPTYPLYPERLHLTSLPSDAQNV